MSKLTKLLLRIGGAVIGIFLLFYFIVGPIMKGATKKHSPEQTITYSQNGVELETFYCSPAKKDRVIFGELVPYGEVWRTGANEATTFETNKDLLIDGQILQAGKYTLWTIPNENSWQVIFNAQMYGWGVKFTDQSPSRDPDSDVLTMEVLVSKGLTVHENFEISFTKITPKNILMMLAWDQTVVPVQMTVKE